ncbi:MAG: glycosyltransferase family 39 protein [Chloroflexi bacterium]|nr:glycosyltransferase family 39 protein [Chloroflexota bacterium]
MRNDVVIPHRVQRSSLVRVAAGLLGGLVLLAAGLAHLRVANDWTATGLWLPLDRVFDLAFTGGFLLLAAGLGWRLLRWLPAPPVEEDERAALAVALGLGSIAYGVLALGLLRLLSPPLLLGLLGALALLGRRDIGAALGWGKGLVLRLDADLRGRRRSLFGLALAVLLAALLLAALVKALMPPAAPDAIGYHLGVPRLYLEAGGIQPLPLMSRAYFPFTVEMLYLVGLAAGTDIFAQLLHFALAVMTGLVALLLARRLDRGAGGLAAAAVVSTPAVAVMATWAYADLGWTFFQVVAFYACFRWWETDDRRWLLLGGVVAGLALGSKYLALHLLVALPPLLVVAGLVRRRSLRVLAQDLGAFVIPAVLVASPWYLKNAWWTGNPVYPFYDAVFRGDLEGAVVYTQALQSTGLGTGRTLLDYLLLPGTLMLNSVRFTGNHAPTAFSPLLFLLPLGVIPGWPRGAGPLAAVAGLLFVLWAVGPQEPRYYLPGVVLLCVLTAVALARLFVRYQKAPALRWSVQATVLAILLVTVYHQITSGFSGWGQGALAFLTGAQSRDQYLTDAYWLYKGLHFLREGLSPGDTVLFLGDAGGYYAPSRFIVDDVLSPLWLLPSPQGYAYPREVRHVPGPILNGVWETARAPTMADALRELYRQDIRYLYLSYVYVAGLTPSEVKAALDQRTDGLRALWRAGVLEVPYADRYGAVLVLTARAGAGP